MKNSVEITRGYQIGHMILWHLAAAMVCIVFELVACWYFLDQPVARYVIAGIFTVVYAFLIYDRAHKFAAFDAKSYTPLQPELKWGLVWGVCIAGITAAAIVIYRLNWMFFSVDGAMTNIFSIIINLMFNLWTAPYFGFISDTNGIIPIFAMILMIVVPIISSVLGYFAGMKHFDIIAALDSLTVEKTEEDE